MQNLNVEMIQQLITLIVVNVMAVVALATVGLGGLILVIRQNRDMVEKLYLSASPETQKLIRDFVVGARDLSQVADEVTDGVVTGDKSTVVVVHPPDAMVEGAPGTGG